MKKYRNPLLAAILVCSISTETLPTDDAALARTPVLLKTVHRQQLEPGQSILWQTFPNHWCVSGRLSTGNSETEEIIIDVHSGEKLNSISLDQGQCHAVAQEVQAFTPVTLANALLIDTVGRCAGGTHTVFKSTDPEKHEETLFVANTQPPCNNAERTLRNCALSLIRQANPLQKAFLDQLGTLAVQADIRGQWDKIEDNAIRELLVDLKKKIDATSQPPAQTPAE